jgi:hypothetical protein
MSGLRPIPPVPTVLVPIRIENFAKSIHSVKLPFPSVILTIVTYEPTNSLDFTVLEKAVEKRPVDEVYSSGSFSDVARRMPVA